MTKELFDKMNGIAISVNTLITESRAKESRCADHKRATDDHEIRIRTLELASSNVLLVTQINKSQENRIHTLELKATETTWASANSTNWKDTLYKAATIAIAIFSTAIATLGVAVAVMKMYGG